MNNDFVKPTVALGSIYSAHAAKTLAISRSVLPDACHRSFDGSTLSTAADIPKSKHDEIATCPDALHLPTVQRKWNKQGAVDRDDSARPQYPVTAAATCQNRQKGFDSLDGLEEACQSSLGGGSSQRDKQPKEPHIVFNSVECCGTAKQVMAQACYPPMRLPTALFGARVPTLHQISESVQDLTSDMAKPVSRSCSDAWVRNASMSPVGSAPLCQAAPIHLVALAQVLSGSSVDAPMQFAPTAQVQFQGADTAHSPTVSEDTVGKCLTSGSMSCKHASQVPAHEIWNSRPEGRGCVDFERIQQRQQPRSRAEPSGVSDRVFATAVKKNEMHLASGFDKVGPVSSLPCEPGCVPPELPLSTKEAPGTDSDTAYGGSRAAILMQGITEAPGGSSVAALGNHSVALLQQTIAELQTEVASEKHWRLELQQSLERDLQNAMSGHQAREAALLQQVQDVLRVHKAKEVELTQQVHRAEALQAADVVALQKMRTKWEDAERRAARSFQAKCEDAGGRAAKAVKAMKQACFRYFELFWSSYWVACSHEVLVYWKVGFGASQVKWHITSEGFRHDCFLNDTDNMGLRHIYL
jgi:uncharacterized lipoprotein YmbA